MFFELWLLAVGRWRLDVIFPFNPRNTDYYIFSKIDFFRRIGEFICIIQKKAVILQRDNVER